MVPITDLDRPLMTLLHIDNQVMVDLLEQMQGEEVLNLPAPPDA